MRGSASTNGYFHLNVFIIFTDYKIISYPSMNICLALLIIKLYTARQSFTAKQMGQRLFKGFIYKNLKYEVKIKKTKIKCTYYCSL